MKNLGYTFYKEYFKNIEFNRTNAGDYIPSLKKNETRNLIGDFFDSNLANYFFPTLDLVNGTIKLLTIYPGLLIGSGYNHEIGKQDNELKLGFFFDYTTGLPCIPGSSVKGVLRDACEKAEGEYAKSIIRELVEGTRKSKLTDEDKNLLDEKLIKVFEGGKNSPFVKMIFVGKDAQDDYIPFSKRDIFFDAFPINSQNENGKFLANDYITPHDNPLKDPVPIQFMKILPQVTFQFSFKLTNKPFEKKIKLELFKQILLDLGVGAKTNVGYGQFMEFELSTQDNSSGRKKSGDKEKGQILLNQLVPLGVKLAKHEKFDSVVKTIQAGYVNFSFNKDGKECLVRKKVENIMKSLKQEKSLEIGDKFTIKIQADYLNTDSQVNFQVFRELI
jgi:CRISPR-associated protein Cmr6